jgi:CheY-like chemotaxis protein
VLLATIPAVAERLSRLLLGQRLVCPVNLAEAQASLSRESFALAVMDVHFDESRMFDLVSSARASPLNRDVPIICVLGVRRKMSMLTVHLLQETMSGMSGCQFLNLTVIADDEAGNALVRAMLGEHLQPALPERTLQQIKPSST